MAAAGVRTPPIAAVLLTDAEIDHTAGLLLLRESATRDSEDRRRAASLASRVVRELELARSAAGIAWSRPDPGPPDATTLADRVEHADGRGA